MSSRSKDVRSARSPGAGCAGTRSPSAGGLFIVFLILVAILAPLIVKITGGPPNEFHQDLMNPVIPDLPAGSFGGMSWDHPMGLETVNGRDIFSRVLYGARISLLIAILATALSVVIGTVLGVVAGFFGGWIDAMLSRHHGHVPGLPHPRLRHSAHRRDPRPGVRPLRTVPAAHPPGLRDRLLQLALHRAHRARADDLAARTGVRRGRPEPWRDAGPTSCAPSCCPT